MEELSKLILGKSRLSRSARGGGRARREARAFYLFILPWIVGFILLRLFPIVMGLVTSLSNYNGFNLDIVRFVGLKNYERALGDELVWQSLANSARYTIVAVPVVLLLAFLLAMMLNRPIKGRDFFRLIYYLPAILPVAGASRAWRLLFGTNSGAINSLIRLVRPGTAINWLLDFPWFVLYVFACWGLGQTMVIFLAGLQGVPKDLYEAARIDGAGRLQLLRWITLPYLSPVIYLQLITGLIAALQVLDAPILIFAGNAAGGLGGISGCTMSGSECLPQSLYMYMINLYVGVFEKNYTYGYGSALAWISFIVVLLVTLLVVGTSRFWVHYEVSQEGEGA